MSIKFEYKDCLLVLLIVSIYTLSVYCICIQYFFITRHKMIYHYLKLKYEDINEYCIPHSIYKCSFLTICADISYHDNTTVIQKVFMSISRHILFFIGIIPIQISAILVAFYKKDIFNSYFFYIFLAMLVLIIVAITSFIIIAKNEKAI